MNARDYTDDDDHSRGKGDPDMRPGKWIGVDMPQTQRIDEVDANWVAEYDVWPLGDQMADHSDDQPYEPEEV